MTPIQAMFNLCGIRNQWTISLCRMWNWVRLPSRNNTILWLVSKRDRKVLHRKGNWHFLWIIHRFGLKVSKTKDLDSMSSKYIPSLAGFCLSLQILSHMLKFLYQCFRCNKCSQLLLILLNCCSCKVTGWFSVPARWDSARHASSRADVSFWILSSCLYPTSHPASTQSFPCQRLMPSSLAEN